MKHHFVGHHVHLNTPLSPSKFELTDLRRFVKIYGSVLRIVVINIPGEMAFWRCLITHGAVRQLSHISVSPQVRIEVVLLRWLWRISLLFQIYRTMLWILRRSSINDVPHCKRQVGINLCYLVDSNEPWWHVQIVYDVNFDHINYFCSMFVESTNGSMSIPYTYNYLLSIKWKKRQ